MAYTPGTSVRRRSGGPSDAKLTGNPLRTPLLHAPPIAPITPIQLRPPGFSNETCELGPLFFSDTGVLLVGPETSREVGRPQGRPGGEATGLGRCGRPDTDTLYIYIYIYIYYEEP